MFIALISAAKSRHVSAATRSTKRWADYPSSTNVTDISYYSGWFYFRVVS